MKGKSTLALLFILSLALLLGWTGGRHPAAGRPIGLTLPWQTADGGGGLSAGSGYTLLSSLAQHDAGRQSGGGFTLSGGFISGGGKLPPPPAGSQVFLPAILTP